MKTARLLVLASVALVAPLTYADPGADLWGRHCKKCHGDAGKGDTAMGKKLAVRDLSDPAVQDALTDEAIRSIIADGKTDEKGKLTMLAFGKKLTPEEINALVAHVRSLKAP